jgi:SAM-dependent methyltransferase
MLDHYDDTPDYWDEKAKISSATSELPPAWVYASQYWRTKFLDICKEALSIAGAEERFLRILKTDLWNEGIETRRDVIGNLKDFVRSEGQFFGIDISRYTVSKAAGSQHDYLNALQSSITALPFKGSIFNLVLDMSTIDHVEISLRKRVIQEYSRVLKPGGVIALVFDKRNLLFYLALLKDFFGAITGRPGNNSSTMLHFGPDSVERLKRYLINEHFDILSEGILALNVGINTLFSSRKSRIFSFLLDHEALQRAIYRLENSRVSKRLGFFALQNLIICRKE